MNNLLANLKHFVSHLILLFMLLSCIIVFIIKKRENIWMSSLECY